MIRSAGKLKISENPALPSVQGVVDTFLQAVKIGIITKTIIRGKTQEITNWKTIRASRQAMTESLAVRKEGERSWRWHVFHVTPDVLLQTDDIVVFQGTQYRIMEKEDWAQYGFLKYNAIENYGPSETA